MAQQYLSVDVVVAGGGMAGVCAALAAARMGAKVALLQDRSMLGGNASSEVRMHIVGADCHGARKGWRESGIIEELRLEDAVRNPSRCYPLWDLLLYEKALAEPNITLLLDTVCNGVEMAHGQPPKKRPARTDRMYEFRGGPGRIGAIHAVRELSEDCFTIHAKQFIDCTGDGRLGYEAGADFRIGRESRAMHGESLAREVDDCHTLGSSILLTSRRTAHPVAFTPPAWARKFEPEDLKVGRSIGTWEYGFWWVEWGGQLDTIKDHHTTIRHELYAIALGLWDYVKNSGRYPDSANWALDWIGALPGKRESRRFLGPHILTQLDIEAARVFPDEVGYGGWAMDDHPPSGVDAKTEQPFIPHPVPVPYGIPLRCLYSRNIDNLLFAGRNVSCTHMGFTSTRVMATCAVLGQAAGTAAAYCISHHLDTPAKISADAAHVKAVQQALIAADATLLHTRGADPRDVAPHGRVEASSHALPHPPELVLDGVLRDEVDQKTGVLNKSHRWTSLAAQPLPQWIELTWDKPVDIRQVHLTFDTGFERTLALTPSDSPHTQGEWRAQPETARDYTLFADGRELLQVRGNYQRKRIHAVSADGCKRLRVLIEATHGVTDARVFEVRVYGA